MNFSSLIVWLLVSSAEFLLIGFQSRQCPDIANYLSHPGIETLTFNPDALLYYSLHLIGSNETWLHGILLSSITIYNLAILSLGVDRLKKLILLSAPFTLSILATHFWSCAIRSGLSISVLILAISSILRRLSGSQPSALVLARKQSLNIPVHKWIPEILLLALAIALHWATSIMIIFLMTAYLAKELVSKLVLNGRLHSKMLIGILFAFLLLVISYFYISDKLLNYGLVGSSQEYGRIFPIVNAYTASIVLFLLPLKRSNPISQYTKYISIMMLFFSFISFLGLTGNLIRLLAPLSLIMIYFYVLGPISLSRLLFCTLACAPPFLYYTLNTYSLLTL